MLQTLAELLRGQPACGIGLLDRRADGEPSGEAMLAEIAAGEIDVVVGTHAVRRRSDVRVRQARPGGDRRAAQVRRAAAGGAASKAGVDPHYLVMTATPIPRTVGMTLFGDLDVSTLRELPPGRQAVHTYLVEPTSSGRGGGSSSARSCDEGRQGVRRRAAGRGIGERRGRQRAADVRAARQRRAGRLSRRHACTAG